MRRCTTSARSSAARWSARSKILAKHRVEVEISPDLPMVMVDAVLFEQVLFNLLDNAAKYAPPDTTVRIQSWREEDSVRLQVLDEGDGIPTADLERIFDKFYRARKGDQVRAGTGLGPGDLARLRRGPARHDHGGEPHRPHGRCVHDHPARPEASGARGGCGMSTASLKILVVDDEPPIRKLLRMGLSSQGYEVLEAPNGKIALELLAKKPALVILDLGLPDIDGHELLRRIRHRHENLPIVVLSSRGDEAGKVAALDLGADDYVTKPFGMDELFARMRAALRHQLQVHGERPVFHVGDLSVDLVRRIVKLGDKEVKLSPKEYDLLRLLVQHAGKVLTHKFLLQELWDEPTDPQYLRVYVRQLRQKIEADPERPQYIMTEIGIGYGCGHPTEERRGPMRIALRRCNRPSASPGTPMKIKDFLSASDVAHRRSRQRQGELAAGSWPLAPHLPSICRRMLSRPKSRSAMSSAQRALAAASPSRMRASERSRSPLGSWSASSSRSSSTPSTASRWTSCSCSCCRRRPSSTSSMRSPPSRAS